MIVAATRRSSEVTEIVGIHHLGLTVSDAERSARWYQDVLGFERVGQLADSRNSACDSLRLPPH
jgi:catechol-2,3-dioxygenase